MVEALDGRAERSRRIQARMDAFLSIERAVSAAAVGFSFLAMFFWAECDVPYLVRLTGALLAFVTIPPAWVGASQGRWSGAAIFGAFLFALQLGFFVYEWSWRPAPFGPGLLHDALISIACVVVLLFAVTQVGLMRSASAVVLFTILGVGLVGLSAVDRSMRGKGGRASPVVRGREAGEARRDLTVVRTSRDGSILGEPARPRPPMEQVEWSYSSAVTDPVLEYRNAPYTSRKTYYPSDPRNYFDREPDSELLDMRCARLRVRLPSAEAHAIPASSRTGSVVVNVTKSAPNAPWDVDLIQLAAVEPGGTYVVLARVRASSPREVVFVATPENADEPLTRESFPIGREWSILPLMVEVPSDLNRLLIDLLVGDTVGSVEIGWISVCRSFQSTNDRLDLRGFRPFSNVGQPPRVLTSWTDRVRMVVPASRESRPIWGTQIQGTRIAIARGRSYGLSFRAKSETKAQLSIQMQERRSPWSSLSNVVRVEVDPKWREFNVTLNATGSSGDSLLQFHLGEVSGILELTGVEFGDSDPGRSTNTIPYQLSPWAYSVIYRLNSEGFRDQDWTLSAPPRTFRIACMGDSYTYGQGVHAEDTFAVRVEREFAKRLGATGGQVDMMNFGVCGYCTRQERLCYEQIASKYKPDLVLVIMHHNDTMTSKEEQEKYAREQANASGGLLSIPTRIFQKVVSGPDYEICVRELMALREECQRDNARLAVCAFRNGDDADWRSLIGTVGPAMQHVGVPFLDLGEHLMQGRTWQDLAVHEIDGHPNELAHELAAERLVEWLVEERLVPTDIR